VNGKELVFRRPGEDSEEDNGDVEDDTEQGPTEAFEAGAAIEQPQVIDMPRITIHEDD